MIRYINRQIVLNYVREKEPISRAEISHETALERSTVSLIVAELKTQGLIYEIEGESTGGRPPSKPLGEKQTQLPNRWHGFARRAF